MIPTKTKIKKEINKIILIKSAKNIFKGAMK